MNSPSNKQDEAVLLKPCLICGKENRFHRVFWSPYRNCYMRQSIESDAWLGGDGTTFVPSSDHYACIDNLEYLEWKDEHRVR